MYVAIVTMFLILQACTRMSHAGQALTLLVQLLAAVSGSWPCGPNFR